MKKKLLSMKKRFLAMAAAAVMCLSAVPVSGSAEDTSDLDVDWIPSNFQEAMDFDNTYGTTHVEDGVICLVFRESENSAYSYDVVPTTDVAGECFHDIFEYEDEYEVEYMHDNSKYEVVAYKPFSKGKFDVALNSTYGDITREDASYQFYIDEEGEITETDLFAWVPDCITEYNDFVKDYGKVSVREDYIVYCGEVNYSTGASLIMEQNGTAEIKEILKSGCSKAVTLLLAGSTSYFVEIYQPVSDGTVDVSWKVGREWELEESIVSNIEKKFEVSENGTSIKEISSALDSHTQRISIVDYHTGELLKFPETVVRTISFQTGFEVEYILTDGTFAWGINWGPISEWDYYAQNPYVIDTSDYLKGFGSCDYRVADIDLPGGYFLPEDYLEVVEYDNDSADIYIKLKKTLFGDVNDDEVFSVADVVLLQRWLVKTPDTKLISYEAADFCRDGNVDVFDICYMKRALLEKNRSKLSENSYNFQLLNNYANRYNQTGQTNVITQDDEALIIWAIPVLPEQIGCVIEPKQIDSCTFKENDGTTGESKIVKSGSVYSSDYTKGYSYCIVKAVSSGDTTLELACDSGSLYVDFVIDDKLNISLKDDKKIYRY